MTKLAQAPYLPLLQSFVFFIASSLKLEFKQDCIETIVDTV